MMTNCSEFKSDAREKLKGRWLLECGIALIVVSIGYLLPFLITVLLPVVGTIIGRFITVPLLFGLVRRYVFMDHGGYPRADELFHYYDRRHLPEVLILTVTFHLVTIPLFILFIIPGVIAYYHFVLYQHIMVDYPELSTKDILLLSAQMMKGYKLELLKLQVSFMGWNILAGLTIIGIIPLVVYKRATYAYFYNEIRRNYEGIPRGVPMVIY